MQRIAFMMKIKPGTEEEYRLRHRQVWPELLADLKRAGCQNYSIYLRDTELFAYMEVDDFQQYLEIMAASTAANQNAWIGFMKDELAAKYPNMKLVKIAYGNDDDTTSFNDTLLCPTGEADLASACGKFAEQQTYPGTKTSHSQAR